MSNKVANGATFLVLTLMLVVFTSSVPPFSAPPPTSAEYCGIDPTLLAQLPTHDVVIEVWASAPRQHCLRAYAPWIAAQQNPGLGLSVQARAHNVNYSAYRADLVAAAAKGEAPDISFVYHYQMAPLLAADYLFPLEECRQQPGLREIPAEFWTAFAADGRAWGVPFEVELLLLFYNKEMLRKLEWSEAAIENFPRQIAQGEFELHDLLAVADDAVARRVTAPGFAFVPHPGQWRSLLDLHRTFGGRHFDRQSGNLVINQQALQEAYTFLQALRERNLLSTQFAIADFSTWGNNILLRDAVAHGRILFWHGYASDWQQMVMDYTQNAEEAVALQKRLGVALLPAGVAGQRGTAQATDLHLYVIFAEKASGRRNQAAACRLLAATHAAQLTQIHADKISQLVPQRGGFALPSYWPSINLQTLDWRFDQHPAFPEYRRILTENGVAIERGELGAAEATTIAIERLQAALGNQLVVE